ncbi:MAG: amidohydrolase family protein [bacterium]
MALPSPGMLTSPLPGIDDAEWPRLPAHLPPVVDAHVHLFPDRVFDALWRWFRAHAWPIRYPLYSPDVIDFLLARGVDHLVALHYAHRPGMAQALNRYMHETTAENPRVTGLATVLPGEPGAGRILEEAFALGLAGVKLHCHVQCFAPDAPALDAVWRVCADHDRPVVIHAGREPKSPAYACDPHALCAAAAIERVLRRYPTLRLCVPHLGADEFPDYVRMMHRYDTLWLDTTMVVGDYLPADVPWDDALARPERLMYGSDFPNIPYAYSRELERLIERLPDPAARAAVLGGTARDFFGISGCGSG